jgi:hypothetical protein
MGSADMAKSTEWPERRGELGTGEQVTPEIRELGPGLDESCLCRTVWYT